jgi:hypothetical protein
MEKNNLVEGFLLEIQSKRKMYHLSQNNLDGKTLIPKIPDNIFNKIGLEDKKIPRISFSTTISQCITAIGYNRVKDNPDKKYIVFEPEDYNKIKIISNEEIIRQNLVVDAKQSGEIWVISNVKLKRVGMIEVLKEKGLAYKIENPYYNKPFKFYKWKYKVLDGNII